MFSTPYYHARYMKPAKATHEKKDQPTQNIPKETNNSTLQKPDFHLLGKRQSYTLFPRDEKREAIKNAAKNAVDQLLSQKYNAQYIISMVFDEKSTLTGNVKIPIESIREAIKSNSVCGLTTCLSATGTYILSYLAYKDANNSAQNVTALRAKISSFFNDRNKKSIPLDESVLNDFIKEFTSASKPTAIPITTTTTTVGFTDTGSDKQQQDGTILNDMIEETERNIDYSEHNDLSTKIAYVFSPLFELALHPRFDQRISTEAQKACQFILKCLLTYLKQNSLLDIDDIIVKYLNHYNPSQNADGMKILKQNIKGNLERIMDIGLATGEDPVFEPNYVIPAEFKKHLDSIMKKIGKLKTQHSSSSAV